MFETRFILALIVILSSLVLIDITDALPAYYMEHQLQYLIKRAATNLPPVQAPSTTPKPVSSSQLLVTVDSLRNWPTDTMSYNARMAQLSYLGFATPRDIAQWAQWVNQTTSDYQGFNLSPTGVVGDKNFGVRQRLIVTNITM
jgi:hypothetical protein